MKRLSSVILLLLIAVFSFVQFAQVQSAVAADRDDVVVSDTQYAESNDVGNYLLSDPLSPKGVELPADLGSPLTAISPAPVVDNKSVATPKTVEGAEQPALAIAAIPEPSSWVLLTLGGAIILVFGFILRQKSPAAAA